MRIAKLLFLFALVACPAANMHAAPQDRGTIEAVRDLIVAVDAKPKQPPVGVWVREVTVNGAKVKVTLTIKDDRLLINYGEKTSPSHFMLDCDYGVTKDYVLFGVVNSVDGEPARPTNRSACATASTRTR